MEDERARGLLRMAAPLVIICSSAGAACAPVTPYNPDHLPPAQMSRIAEICHTVMGLPAGPYTQFQACEESLSHSLAARRERSATLPARQTCEARGLEPETLAACEPQTLDAPLPAAPVESYFSASNDEIHRREQAACAAIGEDSATSASAQCVVDLAGYLFDADNPLWRK